MQQRTNQRDEETDNLTELERNVVPPVLKKKQLEAQTNKFNEEGYQRTNYGLTKTYQFVPTTLRTKFPQVAPLSIFLLLFTRVMFSAWKQATNAFLREKNLIPITKRIMRKYLGMIIHFSVHPLDLMSDHWRNTHKRPGFLARHRFNLIHRNRNFPLRDFFLSINRAFRKHVNLGTELCIDELQAAYAGSSPVLQFNSAKPHKWGHLFYIGATILNKRPYIHSVIAKYPGWHNGRPSTLDIVSYIEAWLPPSPVHITTDCFYNTKGVREYLLGRKRLFTMAARTDWLPHVWRVLQNGIHEDGWQMAIHAPTGTIHTTYLSEKHCNTISNAFNLVPGTRGNLAQPPPPFTHYRENFNVVDLFDRLYYQHPFPHRHTSWKDHMFYVILKMCIVNSWVLYNQAKGGEEVKLHDFMEQLAEALLA